MRFNYDPILGLQYDSEIEYNIILDLVSAPEKIPLRDYIDEILWYKRELNMEIDNVEFIPLIISNYGSI